MKKLVTNPENPNGILVEMTAEQVSAREADIAEYVAGAQAREDAETARLAKLASGKQKLKDLGLDDDELKQILGL